MVIDFHKSHLNSLCSIASLDYVVIEDSAVLHVFEVLKETDSELPKDCLLVW